MIRPEHRRRVLFGAQGLVAVSTLLVAGGLMGVDAGGGVVALVGIPLFTTLAVCAMFRLERAKFHTPIVAAADWANELRTVRDSRREIVGAFEIERRRIERDLHDGAQQYLVAAAMKLGEAGLLLEPAQESRDTRLSVARLVEDAHRDTEEVLRTLRATVAGIHSQMLSDLGLSSAVTDVAERSGLDVTVRCPYPLPEMPDDIAAVAWFFCSEAITNVAKYAPHARTTILLIVDEELHVSVVDEGPGGAEPRSGGGLAGMRERLVAFGGGMMLSSPPGGPTTLTATIPLLLAPAAENAS